MKTSNKPLKRERSLSNSSTYTISDDDSPKQKLQRDRKHSEERHHRSKHQKHSHKSQRHRSSDSSSSDEIKPKYKSSKKNFKTREPDLSPEVRVKKEPLSDDERERKYKNRHRDHSREPDSHGRNESRHHKDKHHRREDHTDMKSRPRDNKGSRPVKDEIRGVGEPEWGKNTTKVKKEPEKNNAKPDFGLSGKLTEDTNTYKGVVIKYSEPPEARKPKRRWRLYPFKGETSLPVLYIHRQSAYLMGRDRKIADIPIDHPSCSKQHAALQYRLASFTRPDGSQGKQIKPYIIDLESANGTFLNNVKIEARRYYSLNERDVLKFGFSSREYVLLHEHSKDSDHDDDVKEDN